MKRKTEHWEYEEIRKRSEEKTKVVPVAVS